MDQVKDAFNSNVFLCRPDNVAWS